MSVVYPEPSEPYSAIHPLRSTGGWLQLKCKPATRYEINGAFGQDENFARDLRAFPTPYAGHRLCRPCRKNRTELVNFIYQPNSFLSFRAGVSPLVHCPRAGRKRGGVTISTSRREFAFEGSHASAGVLFSC